MKRVLHASTVLAITVLLLMEGCTPSNASQTAAFLPTAVATSVSSFPATNTPIANSTATVILITPTLEPRATPSSTATATPLPTNTVCAPPAGWPTYIVQPGENLFRIALRYNLSTEQLQAANCLASAETIFAGQTIYVPFFIPPTPVPPTQPQTPGGLKEEVGYDPGGADDSPTCDAPTPGGTLQITYSSRVRDAYETCAYGFPLNQQITIKLLAPDGHLVASKGFQVIERLGDTTIVRIPLWMPVGMPTGSWTVIAESTSNGNTLSITRPINIERNTKPAINTMPYGEINPLESYKCGHYPPGSRMVIRGANYTPNAQLPLAFYVFPPPPATGALQLAHAEFVDTNSQGDFSTLITIGASDTGGYLVVIALNPNTPTYVRLDGDNDCYTVP